MNSCAPRRGFTLVEVLIVVVIMAVLAAAILPQVGDTTRHSRRAAGEFNCQTLRKQIELYKTEHDGLVPSATLAELLARTDSLGNIGSGPAHVYGPYLRTIPENPFTGSTVVRIASQSPPSAASGADDAGWLYHAASGRIWLDHPEYLGR